MSLRFSPVSVFLLRQRFAPPDDLRAVAGGVGEEDQTVAEGMIFVRRVHLRARSAQSLRQRIEVIPRHTEGEMMRMGERRYVTDEEREAPAPSPMKKARVPNIPLMRCQPKTSS